MVVEPKKAGYTRVMIAIQSRARLLFLLFLCLALLPPTAAGQSEPTPDAPDTRPTGQAPGSRTTASPNPEPTSGELYTPLTFPVQIDSTLYTNPFDSSDIELLGVFQPPSGEDPLV